MPKPMAPIRMMPIITISVSWNFDATMIIMPAPCEAATSSAATTVPQQTPIATRAPVKISGSELGMITCSMICAFEAPSE